MAYGQHIAGDTTVHNQITLAANDGRHTGSTTSLFDIQPGGGSGPIFAAWNEIVTVDGDPNAYDQVEFVRHASNLAPVDQYFTYQIADGQAQNIKLQSHNYSSTLGTGTMVELAYGDGTFTTIVEFFYNTTSGTTTQVGTYTEATPEGQTYNTIRDLGDGRVAIVYDDQIDSAGTTQVTTKIVDFRNQGLKVNWGFTGSISGATLTVSGVLPGTTVALGDSVNGAGVAPNTTITGFGTGTGGTGTYAVSAPQTISTESMSLNDGIDKYFAGTQFNDVVVGENNVGNTYYYVGRNAPVGPSPTDTFSGGNNSFNIAIFPDAKSNYTLTTNGATTTVTANVADTQHLGSLSVNNVQLLAFAPTNDPSPTINGVDHVLEASGGLFDLIGSFNGIALIDSGATLEINNSASGPAEIVFAGSNATLQLDQTPSFTGSLNNFSAGDVIDLPAFAMTSATILTSYTATNTTLIVTDATHTVANGTAAQFTLNGNYTASMFSLTNDGHGGVAIAVDAPTLRGFPSTVQTSIGTPQVITAASGPVTDPNAGNNLLLVTLKVRHGTLGLVGSTANINISQNGSSGTLSFTGTLAVINQLLPFGITYTPTAGFTGADALSIAVNGQVVGDPFSAVGTVDIYVAPNVLTGSVAAGTSNPSTPAPLYELTGASITGAGGHGLNVVTPDTNATDVLTVQMDAASLISVSGNNFNGLNLTTSGASIVVNTAGSITASGTGGFGINANIQSGNGSVSVNALANVSGASNGIRAFTNSSGSGSVDVYVGPNVTITGTALYGIYASALGTGDISVSTAPGDMIASGSAGIIAENYSTLIASSAQSVINVTASGTINSGAALLGNGNKPSGILAGYNPGSAAAFNSSVFGEVNVNNFANITAAGFSGIFGYNYGIGDITLNDAPNTTITNSAGFGIVGVNYGPGNIFISTSSGDVINTSSAGVIATSFATAVPATGSIVITTSGAINSGVTPLNSGSTVAGVLGIYNGGTSSPANPPNPSVFGDVTINNSANITALGGDGIRAQNYGIGNITVTDAPNATIAAIGDASSRYGIYAQNLGPGSTSVTTSAGDVISSASAGIYAINNAASVPAASNSSVVVTANGTINSGTVQIPGGFPAAGILAAYNFNNSLDSNVFDSVIVDDFANIAAAGGDGIRAYNWGIGNVAVIDEPGTTITATGDASSRYGIYAQNLGPGNTSVTTSAGDVINSAGAGIHAINSAASVSAASSSSVSVTARGTINSGTVLNGNGSVAAGILAGYNFNTSPDNNVVGAVTVDDFASITAATGTDGIRAFNYGVGPGTVMVTAEPSAVISAGRFGIAANGNGATGITVISGGTVTGGTAGINVAAVTNGSLSGDVNITVSGGTVSSPAAAIQVSTAGSVIIKNSGQIIHGTVAAPSAAGIAISETTGNSITIDNFNHIVGDVTLANATFNNHSGAVWDVSGSNTFGGGTDTLNNDGTINVLGNSSFTATGTLNVVGSGSFTIADSVTLEFGGSVAATQTVNFSVTTTTETLKIDHSLTAPFSGHISGLTGSPKDAIDLADLTYNGVNTTAVYTPLTGTSGTLVVSDGNGHNETFNLINYTGSGNFITTSDSSHGGTGGTWIVDPPTTQDLASGTFIFKDLNSADAQTVNVSPENGGAGYVGSFTVDAPNQSNGQAVVGWHFNVDQTAIKQTATQTYDVTLTDAHTDGTKSAIAQSVSITIGGSANDTFIFKPGFGADTVVNAKSVDTIELDGFSSVTTLDQLQTLLHEAQTSQPQTLFQSANGGHDTVINLGNSDVITLANVQLVDLHADNFIIHT